MFRFNVYHIQETLLHHCSSTNVIPPHHSGSVSQSLVLSCLVFLNFLLLLSVPVCPYPPSTHKGPATHSIVHRCSATVLLQFNRTASVKGFCVAEVVGGKRHVPFVFPILSHTQNCRGASPLFSFLWIDIKKKCRSKNVYFLFLRMFESCLWRWERCLRNVRFFSYAFTNFGG